MRKGKNEQLQGLLYEQLPRNSHNGIQATVKTDIKMEAKQNKKSRKTDRCST